jgi:autotransporter-associated beta strand protein
VAVTFAGAGNVVVADAIATGTGGLTKEGAGTLTLSGANTFTGATNVNEGTLIVNGSLAATANDLTVADNAILSGTGSIGTDAVINGDLRIGTTAANGSVGTLTFTDAGAPNPGVGFGATGTWLVDLIEGTSSSDRLVVEGNLSIDPAAILSFNVLTGTPFSTSSIYTIATYGGSLSGAFSGWTDNAVYTIGGGDYVFSYGTGSNSAITLTAVPEPGTLGLLGLALGGFFVRRLRKRRAEAGVVGENREA